MLQFFRSYPPLFVGLLMLLIACSPPKASRSSTNLPCTMGLDLLETDLQDYYFDFDENTELNIDLNRDGKDDFQFAPARSGNRIARFLSGNSPGHQVSQQPFLEAGTRIDSTMEFARSFNLNQIDRDLDNDYGTLAGKYIALRMQQGEEYHYGWLKFSTTDSTPGAPLYYGNLSLTLHAQAFNRDCGGITTP